MKWVSDCLTVSSGTSDSASPCLCPQGEVFDYLVAHGRMKEKEARAKFRQVGGRCTSVLCNIESPQLLQPVDLASGLAWGSPCPRWVNVKSQGLVQVASWCSVGSQSHGSRCVN